MNARHALALAGEHGIRIRRDGERLSLEATEEPSAEVLAAIQEAKPELLRLLGDEGEAAQHSRSSTRADLIGEAALVREPQNTCSQRQLDESRPAPSWGNPEQERAAIAEYDGNIPRVWAEGFARLDPGRPPGDVPPRRWQRFVDDVGRFLDSPFCANAAALGWGPYDLFGCDRDRPVARIDKAGLLWLLDGDKLIALSENTATIETRTGARQTYRRKPSGEHRVLAWELGNAARSDADR